jgi:hypothetical protein
MGTRSNSLVSAAAETGPCPICGGVLVGDAANCSSCGFPTALFPEARAALLAEDEADRAEGSRSSEGLEGGPSGSPGEPEVAEGPGTTLAVEVEETALALQDSLRVAQNLELDATSTAESLATAAMSAARGRLEEARATLARSSASLEPALAQRFDERCMELEEREGLLREDGVAADVAREISRARTAFREGARFEGVSSLRSADEALLELERDWKQLKETLLKIDAFRDVGGRLGLDLATLDARLHRVRLALAEESMVTEDLREASTQASAILVLMHEQVRQTLFERAGRATEQLASTSLEPTSRDRAERHVALLQRHVRAGRFKEAAEEYFLLRKEVPEIVGASTPAPIPSPPETAEAPAPPEGEKGPALAEESAPLPPEPEARSVSEILTEARQLASSLKSRQSDGTDVREAASLLMTATRQLGEGRLADAEATLRRLKDALAPA